MMLKHTIITPRSSDREWKARQMMKAAEQEAARVAEEKQEDDARRDEAKKVGLNSFPLLAFFNPPSCTFLHLCSQKKDDWENGRDKRIGGWRNFVKGKVLIFYISMHAYQTSVVRYERTNKVQTEDLSNKCR